MKCPLLTQELWPTIHDASPNGVIAIGTEGSIHVYNKRAHDLCAYDGDVSPIGRHLQDVHPEMWVQVQDVFITEQSSQGVKYVFGEATVVNTASPIFGEDNSLCGVMCVFHDISEIEDKLQIIKHLHKELQGIFESSHDGLFITDADARVIMCNPAYESVTGLKREDLIGKTMYELLEDGVYDHSSTLAVFEKKTTVSLIQSIKDNRKVLVTGVPIFNERGEIELVVSNVRDLNALNRMRAELEDSRRIAQFYQDTIRDNTSLEELSSRVIFKSKVMHNVLQQIAKAARYAMPVLLQGESGVGKTRLAKEIHRLSDRKDKPFLKINCGAIPENLIESELFGYTKGAFTGALEKGKIGLFEAANKGTLFLDETSELTPAMQVKLLEVIEENCFLRIGDTEKTHIDVRIITASNADLQAMVEEKTFRSDLFYRLNVISINIPPLRERKEDISALARHYLSDLNRRHELHKRMITGVVDILCNYTFPGNIRELKNLIERMYVFAEEDTITLEDLPAELWQSSCDLHAYARSHAKLKDALEEAERSILREALLQHESLENAASHLGVHHSTLWRKVKKYDLASLCNPAK